MALTEDGELKGNDYRDLIATYVVTNFAERHIEAYTEVDLGKSIIGKNRRIDLFLLETQRGLALGIECKYQRVQGTADEKIPYTLKDVEAMRTPGCIVYAGEGWSPGVRHLLEGSHMAAFCLPGPGLARASSTKEFDHVLAQTFGWWDIILEKKRRFVIG